MEQASPKQKAGGFRKCRGYLYPFFWVMLLGVIVSLVVGQILVTTKYGEVQFTMSLIAKTIEMRLDDARNITELAAKMPCVSVHDSAEAERYLNEIINKNPEMWSHFLITDENGTEIAHTEGSIHYGKSLATRDYYKVPWSEKRTIVAQPLHSISTGRKIIAIGVPTYHDGEGNGVLVGFIHLGYVSALLNENDFSANSYLFMANHDGTISAHLKEEYVLAKSIRELMRDDTLLSKAEGLRSGIGLDKIEGKIGLVASAPINAYRLSIMSFIPFGEAFIVPIIVVSVLLAIFTFLILLLAFREKFEKSVAFGKEMQNTANTDRLTGLKNRHWLDTISIDAYCDKFLTAIFLDIDDFKKYNDEHNHAYGDAVLKFVGQSLVGSTRPDSDICVRYAGDEFVVLFRDTPIIHVVPIVERIIATLEGYQSESRADPIYISCGIACAQKDEMTLEALIVQADNAAYKAKRSGKRSIVIEQ